MVGLKKAKPVPYLIYRLHACNVARATRTRGIFFIIDAGKIARLKVKRTHFYITFRDAADKAAYNKIMSKVVDKWADGNERRKKTLDFVRAELKKLRAAKK